MDRISRSDEPSKKDTVAQLVSVLLTLFIFPSEFLQFYPINHSFINLLRETLIIFTPVVQLHQLPWYSGHFRDHGKCGLNSQEVGHDHLRVPLRLRGSHL